MGLVTATTGIEPERLVARSRGAADVAVARHLVMYLLRVLCSMQFTEIGRLLGRDASTVAHSCAVIEDRRDDPGFEDFVSGLEARLQTQPLERNEVRFAQG